MKITDDVKEKIDEIINTYNQGKRIRYLARFQVSKGFLFLDRDDGAPKASQICRLKYNGKMDNWEFAIYKYSSNAYSPDEFFPGVEFVDGTIEGAMKAGDEAYA